MLIWKISIWHFSGLSTDQRHANSLTGTSDTGNYNLYNIRAQTVVCHIVPGDAVLGFPSSGLHTNGYSLARKILFDMGGLGVTSNHPDLDVTIGEALLKPHINYTLPIRQLVNSDIDIKGLAHITGGGLVENIPRILPENCSVNLDPETWPIPPIINLIQNIGDLDKNEMIRTFNMGIGLVLIINKEAVTKVKEIIGQSSQIFKIGKVIAGNQKVIGF